MHNMDSKQSRRGTITEPKAEWQAPSVMRLGAPDRTGGKVTVDLESSLGPTPHGPS